jgi:hypothetical protein
LPLHTGTPKEASTFSPLCWFFVQEYNRSVWMEWGGRTTVPPRSTVFSDYFWLGTPKALDRAFVATKSGSGILPLDESEASSVIAVTEEIIHVWME